MTETVTIVMGKLIEVGKVRTVQGLSSCSSLFLSVPSEHSPQGEAFQIPLPEAQAKVMGAHMFEWFEIHLVPTDAEAMQ